MPELGSYEPVGSRESVVIAAIGAAFAPADSIMKLTTRELTVCGPALSPRLINRVFVRETMRQLVEAGSLTMIQFMLLWYRFGKGATQVETMRHFHITCNKVRVEEAAGLQTMVRVIWEDPTYVTPTRTHRPDPLREMLRGMRAKQA